MERGFEEKAVLITGGASGIGRAAALAFARRGAKLAIADMNPDAGEETVRLVKDVGEDAVFVKTDVTSPEEIERMVEMTIDRFGRLDVGVNNAGIEGDLAPTAEYSDDMWERVISVNLTGVWRSMRAEIPHILKSGGGAIVNVASILGVVGFGTTPAYTAAKHGVLGLTKVAALEYAPQGIRINAVCPGFIETGMVMERGVKAGKDPEAHQGLVDLHPIGRLGQPEEIADAITWLASDEATFLAGHALVADGGYVAR
jgi:NAD(P)-dependent dehydrogenase (short-subunit alcohol dehydrogenase family)